MCKYMRHLDNLWYCLYFEKYIKITAGKVIVNISVPRDVCCFWEIPQLFFQANWHGLSFTTLWELLPWWRILKQISYCQTSTSVFGQTFLVLTLCLQRKLDSLARCITPGLVLVLFLPSSSYLAAFLNLRLLSSTSQNCLEFFLFFRLLHRYLSGKEKQSKFSSNFLTNCRWNIFQRLCMECWSLSTCIK